jgi:hypothetical protein
MNGRELMKRRTTLEMEMIWPGGSLRIGKGRNSTRRRKMIGASKTRDGKRWRNGARRLTKGRNWQWRPHPDQKNATHATKTEGAVKHPKPLAKGSNDT